MKKYIVDLMEFDLLQIAQIKKGLRNNLDVSIYAKPCFNYAQMQEIRYGLMVGIDVSPYLNPNISSEDMMKIRLSIQNNI